jgi:hypothetical protein
MPTVKLTKKKLEQFQKSQFLYFDLECYTVDGKFVPNYAVVQSSSGEQRTFPENHADIGRDITGELCAYIFQKAHKGFYVIAHNLKGSVVML